MGDDADLDLLRRHAPGVRFDRAEGWRPSATAAFLHGSSLWDGNRRVIAQGVAEADLAPGGRGAGLKAARLDPLHGEGLGHGERTRRLLAVYGPAIDLTASGACYGRVVPGTSPKLLQYWLFYIDNPALLAGFGRHDGDWELIQLRLSADEQRCTHVTVAQHGHPETRPLPDGRAPTIYVARHSHAAYLRPGTQPRRPVPDHCDPGPEPDAPLEVLALPEGGWIAWAGRWGDDRGVGTWWARLLGWAKTPGLLRRLDRGVDLNASPPSPATQDGWDAEAFERTGRVRAQTAVRAREAAHGLGRLTWPKHPSTVTLSAPAGGRLEAAMRPAGRGLRRTRRTMIDLLDAAGQPAGRVQVEAGGTAQTARPPGAVRWQATDYNVLRQPGPTTDPADLPADPQ